MRCEEYLYHAQLRQYCGINLLQSFCCLGPWSCNTLSAFQLFSVSDCLVKHVRKFLLFGYGIWRSVCVLAMSEYAGISYFSFKYNLRFGRKAFFIFSLNCCERLCQRFMDTVVLTSFSLSSRNCNVSTKVRAFAITNRAFWSWKYTSAP